MLLGQCAHVAGRRILGDGVLDDVDTEARSVAQENAAVDDARLRFHHLITGGHVVHQVFEQEEVRDRRQHVRGAHLRDRPERPVVRGDDGVVRFRQDRDLLELEQAAGTSGIRLDDVRDLLLQELPNAPEV